MSNAAPYHVGPEADRSPTPELGVVQGSKEHAEQNEAEHRYLDYDFNLTAEQIVESEPTGIFGPVSVTHAERAQAVFSALEANCGEEFSALGAPESRERRLRRATNYLGEDVTVHDGKHKRRHLIDKGAAIQEVLDDLQGENHPVVQVLSYIHGRFRARLPAEALDRLAYELVTVTEWNKLKNIYAQQVDKRR